MTMHYRNRRPMYGVRTERRSKRTIARLIVGLVALFLLYTVGKGIIGLFGGGGGVEEAATLTVEAASNVDVSYEGNEFQAAESATKLQPGDSVRTTGNSHASLSFFDGTTVRLDESSEVRLDTSERGRESAIAMTLTDGTLWMLTPETSSGSVERIVTAGLLTLRVPVTSEVLIGPRTVIVYSAGEDGVMAEAQGSEPVTIGEGQQLSIPNDAEVSGDLREYRTGHTLASLRNAFASESRRAVAGEVASGATGTDETLLSISGPEDNAIVTESSVRARGRVDASVRTLRVNGTDITLNDDGTFVKDLPILGDEDFRLHFEALDSTGRIVAEESRTVRRKPAETTATNAPAAAVTEPAKTGETYRTTAAEVVIRGTVPAGTQKVIVNDYELKLFDPAKGTFSYLARLDLNNMKPGTNTYDVYAVDASGQRSAPARLTIIHGEEGPTTPSSSPTSTSTSSAPAVATPQNNAPLTPGALKVTAPAAGTSYTTTGTGFLLEGTTSKETASVWVNDYRLQLFKPGGGYWNYIVSTEFPNMKPGTNAYIIVARNEKGEVLDRLEYTVTYETE